MNLIKSDYFNTFRYKCLIVIYDIELNCIYKGEKTPVERAKKEEKKERSRNPVLMYECVCLTEGVCKLKHNFNFKRNVSF